MPDRARLRRLTPALGTIALATACAVAVALPPASHAGSWSAVLPAFTAPERHPSPNRGVAIDAGRVWTALVFTRYRLESSTDHPPYTTEGMAIESRPIDGGRVARQDLDFGAVPRPSDSDGTTLAEVAIEQFRVRDGRVFLVGRWMRRSYDPSANVPDPRIRFSAVFDAGTGGLLRYEQPDQGTVERPVVPPEFLYGDPAVLADGGAGREGLLERPLRDPWTGIPLPFPAARGAFVAGAFALVPSPNSGGVLGGWPDGSGTLRVVEIATGRIVYRVTARRITRAAGARRNARPVVGLLTDGSLAVTVPAAGRVVRPVAVDPSGRVVRVGRTVRGVTTVAAAVHGDRAIVGLERARYEDDLHPDVRRGIWLVDRAGKSARRIAAAAPKRFVRSTLLPFWWDGERALWGTDGPRQRTGLAALTATGSIPLRRDERPSARRLR